MSRSILHCDLNNFFASVECVRHPEWKDRPVAVCGSVKERHGICLAKNYPAKKYGIRTGDTVIDVLKKCPDAILAEPHYEEYEKYSRLTQAIYEIGTNFFLSTWKTDVPQNIAGITGIDVAIANIESDLIHDFGREGVIDL